MTSSSQAKLCVESVAMPSQPNLNLYEESIFILTHVYLAYNFADIMKAYRDEDNPIEFCKSRDKDNDCVSKLKEFKGKNIDFVDDIDFREVNDDKDGLKHGLSFYSISNLLKENIDELKEHLNETNLHEPEWLDCWTGNRPDLVPHDDEWKKWNANIFLVKFRSFDQKTQCVYGIIKDIKLKTITVTFRGTRHNKEHNPTKDWDFNLKGFCKEMKTPDLIRDKMDESLKEHVLVHEGFKEYLFDNEGNTYKQICEDIANSIRGEEDEDEYKVYVTGHSLGGALASLMAFQMAGSTEKINPRPVTCITFASPRIGTAGFRAAFEQLEKEGHLRCLRFNIDRDVVAATPSVSLPGRIRKSENCGDKGPFTCKPFKHVGVNIRLLEQKQKPCKPGEENMARIKFGDALHYHDCNVHFSRLFENKDFLEKLTIEDLYGDETYVSKAFSQDYAARCSNHQNLAG